MGSLREQLLAGVIIPVSWLIAATLGVGISVHTNEVLGVLTAAFIAAVGTYVGAVKTKKASPSMANVMDWNEDEDRPK